MALVSLQELLDHMGNPPLTDRQRAHTEMIILPGVQTELQDYLNRPVEKVRVREVLTPDETGYVYFSVTPVWHIESITDFNGNTVTVDPEAVRPTLPALPPSEDPDLQTLDLSSNLYNPRSFRYYVGYTNPYLTYVTRVDPQFVFLYYGGVEGFKIPGLKLAVLDVAARSVTRQWDNTVGLRDGAIESANDSDPRKKHWEQDELEKWDRLRRRVMV